MKNNEQRTKFDKNQHQLGDTDLRKTTSKLRQNKGFNEISFYILGEKLNKSWWYNENI